MKPPTSHREPSFRGQALLILLPVGLLTLAGFWALRQDRRLVEQDAGERAAAVLQALAARMEQSLPFGLVDGTLWETSDEPTTPSAASPRFLCRWGPNGRLLDPPDYEDPPVPPQWWRDLTPEQRTEWDALTRPSGGEDASTNLDQPLAVWLETNPPGEAQAAARFELMRASTEAAGFTNCAPLLAFAREHPRATAPSGLPLISTVAATLLSHPENDPQRPLLTASLLTCVVGSPSVLTPLLLQRAVDAARNQTNGPLEEVMALVRVWQAMERLRELARALTSQATGNGGAGNAWLKADDVDWLACFGPDPARIATGSTNPPDSMERIAWFVPRWVVERALGRVLDYRNDGGLPYAWLEVSIAGRRMTPAGLSAPSGTNAANAPLLGETDLSLPRVAAWETDPNGSGALRRKVDDFTPLPAAIPVRLSLRLVHPELLYARQSQRAWLLGALITAAAGAALLGLAGAHRAFRRQLRLAELKSNFVSSVSHELRAPIASVRLLAESLERGKVTEEPRRHEYFRLIGQECRRLSGLIDNVLDFSRIDQGRKRYEFEPTDLTALVGQTVHLMEPYAAERRVDLAFTPPDDPIELVADGRALQQALVNLLDNAIKHSPEGSPVVVELVRTRQAVRLSVADSGPGIPTGDRERIFEPFFRRGSELRRETQGAGIGLSIVRHVVDAHQGRVFVASPVSQMRKQRDREPVRPPGGQSLPLAEGAPPTEGGLSPSLVRESPPGQGTCFTLEIPFPSEGHE